MKFTISKKLRFAIGSCLIAFSVSALTANVNADVILVPHDQGTIQDAIDVAVPGDLVLIDDGVYTGLGNRDIRFHGKSITVSSINGPEHVTVDAQGTPEFPYRGFVFDSGEMPDAVLDGITIRGGATLPGAVSDQFNGGGLFFSASHATVRNCVISGNKCGCWGGGVYCTEGAAPTLINCDISNNETGDDGGGLFLWNNASPTLVNCCLNNNRAPQAGGAICDFGGSFTNTALINCVLANNEGPFGSAIFGMSGTIKNSIIWGRQGDRELIYRNNASSMNISNSIVDGGFETGTGIIDADPGFVDASNGDYRLVAGSPAIDAGDNSAFPLDLTDMDNDGDTSEPIPFDFNHRSRFIDDPETIDTGSDFTRIADLGPFEFQIGSSVVEANTFSLSRGTLASGGVQDLSGSDNSDLSIRRSKTDVQSRTEFVVSSTSPAAFPIALQVDVEGSVFARTQVVQSIELFDFLTATWEQVDSRDATKFSDSTTAVTVSGDLSRFVQSGTNAVEARIGFQSAVGRQRFTSHTDLFSLTIE